MSTTRPREEEETACAPSPKRTKLDEPEQRLRTLSILRHLHFLFLGIFAGVEFTLTFLTFDREYP